MQLLGKNLFHDDEEGQDALGEMMREKRLLGDGVHEQEEKSPEKQGFWHFRKAGVSGNNQDEGENHWYHRVWQVMKDNRKHLIVATSVLVIGAAVYFNWYLYRNDQEMVEQQETLQNNTEQALDESLEAQNVSDSDYFAVSQINRERARDEAMEVLQTVIDGDASEEVVNDAMNSMAKLAEDIENEGQIETLVKSKGFENCAAVISGDSASVIVKSDGLLDNELTQIQEIVYETAGILPANLKIIEK